MGFRVVGMHKHDYRLYMSWHNSQNEKYTSYTTYITLNLILKWFLNVKQKEKRERKKVTTQHSEQEKIVVL